MADGFREYLRAAYGFERVGAWALLVLAIAFTVAVVTQPGVLATSPPEATFEGSFENNTNTLRLEHGGGDPIRSGQDSSLVVVVEDAQTDNEATVTWVADGPTGVASYPVQPGDSIAIDDATIDGDGDGDYLDRNASVGFALDDGDTARVVWYGRPIGAPAQQDVTLSTIEAGATSES